MDINTLKTAPSISMRANATTSQTNYNTTKSEEKSSDKKALLLGSLAALAIGAGIYIATKGKKGTPKIKPSNEVPTNITTHPPKPSNINNAGEVIEETSNLLIGEKAIEQINKDFEAGIRTSRAYIPKNNKNLCVVISESNSNNTHTMYQRVFNIKDLKYNSSINNIEAEPISERLFKRSLSDRNTGSLKSTVANGTKTSLKNNFNSSTNSIHKESEILSKDGSCKYSKTRFSNINKDNIISEIIQVPGSAAGRQTINGKANNATIISCEIERDNMTDNELFDKLKELAFNKFRK